MKLKQKRLIVIVVTIIVLTAAKLYVESYPDSWVARIFTIETTPSSQIQQTIDSQHSGAQVQFDATVIKLLADDNVGSRHQRFLVRITSGSTLLIAHNIDLAPRVVNVKPDVMISINGEYEWNKRGGVVHWTHHDPAGKHPDGWIEYRGRRYQ